MKHRHDRNPRLMAARNELDAGLASLFSRCPELSGFAVSKQGGELFLSDLGISIRLSEERHSEIVQDIVGTIAEVLDESPEAWELLTSRTFVRRLH